LEVLAAIGEHVQQHRWRMSTSVGARTNGRELLRNCLALKTIDLSMHQRDRCWHPRVRTVSRRHPRRTKRPIEKTARCAPACIVRRPSCVSASTRCHRTCVSSRGFELALTGYWRLAFESVLLNHIVHDDLVSECPEVEVLLCRCLFDGHWGISVPTCASSHGDVTSPAKYAEAFKFATAMVTLALHI
jgi:hypothetical protein